MHYTFVKNLKKGDRDDEEGDGWESKKYKENTNEKVYIHIF
ncbi:MAG: hypothetical protein N3F62_08840 [Bacteroidia bacterium]|nr:hypothetical protein [Bacteroidia bacterium]